MNLEFSMRYIMGVLMLVGLIGCGNGGDLAAVDGRSVTREDFNAYLTYKRIQAPDEQRRTALLKKYLEREALAAAIEKSELPDRKVIEAEINEVRKEILISRYLDRFVKAQLTDEALRKYYESHSEEFSESQVHVAHILIRKHPMMSDDQRRAMVKKAEEVRDRIENGKGFAELAKEVSQDKATAHKGGDLGWIKKGAMGQKFSDAAFSLTSGEVSKPVETAFGYHLITVHEAPRSVMKPFESVKGTIRNKIKLKARSKEMERLLASIDVKMK